MLEVTRAGAVICPATIDDFVKQMVGRMLDLFDLDSGDFERWNGIEKE